MSIRQFCTWMAMAAGTHRCFKSPSTRKTLKPQALKSLRDVLKAMERYFSERGERIIAERLDEEWKQVDEYMKCGED